MLPRFALLIGLSSGLFAQTEPCPRPAIASAIIDPENLHSADGKLQVDFSFQRFAGRYGTRYCYVTANNLQAPTLRVHPGDELVIRLHNELPPEGLEHHMRDAGCAGSSMGPASTNLHFHGLALPPTCHQDETLRTSIQPGDPPFEYRVKIPADEPPGLYWYHPHPHAYSEPQVLGGASGALIVEGIERQMPEVAGLPERVLVLRDQVVPGIRSSDEDAGPGKNLSLNFVAVMFPRYWPGTMTVRPGERQFWRVLNASADTYFHLQIRFGTAVKQINTPQAFELIAIDGVPLGASSKRSEILLSPGARAEFITTTPPPGNSGQLVAMKYDTGPDGAATPERVLANIVPSRSAPQSPVMPNVHNAIATPFTGLAACKPARRRKLYMSEERGDPKQPKSAKYFITEKGSAPKVFDMSFTTPDITVEQGTTEDWVIENRAREAHSFHIHQLHFQLMERDGQPVGEAMLRDTIDLPYWDGQGAYPSITLRMDFRNPNILGTFVYHCHILEHEDGGMMGSIRVVRPAVRNTNSLRR